MAQLFPRWINRIPSLLVLGVVAVVTFLVFSIWYWWSPWYTDVGYAPIQPVPYSHKLHAGELGIDCRYCHTGVEVSSVAMVPPTQTCMNCHAMIKADSPKLTALRDSWNNKTPMEWVRIHKIPDYAYFDHSVHIHAGVGCETCHGNIASMERVAQNKPLSMKWCLDCHRNPDPYLRPAHAVTVMNWTPPANQMAFAAEVKKTKHINPPVTCAGCHR